MMINFNFNQIKYCKSSTLTRCQMLHRVWPLLCRLNANKSISTFGLMFGCFCAVFMWFQVHLIVETLQFNSRNPNCFSSFCLFLRMKWAFLACRSEIAFILWTKILSQFFVLFLLLNNSHDVRLWSPNMEISSATAMFIYFHQ